jgi:glyoxylase-like metal-dependent hydrolase (beta-lactamase superfamily II)
LGGYGALRSPVKIRPSSEAIIDEHDFETVAGFVIALLGRYFESRDALITELIIEAYQTLAIALEQADAAAPILIDFQASGSGTFPQRHVLTRAGDVQLVSTPGHNAGHMSLLLEEGDHIVFFAGDASYTQALLLSNTVDGVATNPHAHQTSQRTILSLASETPTVYLPSHEWDAERRLLVREPISVVEPVA